jgi:hypothetical protein
MSGEQKLSYEQTQIPAGMTKKKQATATTRAEADSLRE